MSHLSPEHGSFADGIARAVIPFSLESLDSQGPAIDRMVGALGDSVEVLGFGEALHGGEEILQFRNCLFRRLVEAHGYSAITIESSFPRGRVINDFVAGRGPESYAAVRETGFSHGFGELDANRELVEWIREYNADAAHPVQLRFYGFDMPGITGGPASPREVLTFVLDYLAEMDPETAGAHRERIDPLLRQDADWENPMPWMDPATSTELLSGATLLRAEIEDLISTLLVRRPEWLASGRGDPFAEALHYARVARQFLTFFTALARGEDYGASLGVRDALMADNLAYILERERGRGKVLVFAHNKHVQRGRADLKIGPATCTWWPAGAHLASRLGARYAVLGSAVGFSEANGIALPEAGSFEALLTATPGPIRFLSTCTGREFLQPVLSDLPLRSGSAKNPSYFALTPQSLTDFDGWVAFDEVTYNRGGRPLP